MEENTVETGDDQFKVYIVGEEEDFGKEYILDPGWRDLKLEDDMNQLGRLFKWPVEDKEGELIQFVTCEQLSLIEEESLGGVIWDSSVVLGKYMEKYPELIRGKRTLDLGSGTGITGLVAAALGASEVYVTEYENKVLIDLLERNVKLNSFPNSKVIAKPLTWANESHHKELNPPFELIIGSDLLYQDKWVPDLLNTLENCLSHQPNSKIILCYKIRPNKTAPFVLLEEAEKSCFNVERIPFDSHDSIYRDESIHIVHLSFKNSK